MEILTEHLDLYLDGFVRTIALSLLSFAAAMVLGTVVAAARVSRVAPARGAGLVFVEVIRNTPLLVLFVIFVFGFPKIGILYPLFTSSVIVLAVYTGAFISETLRSGINSVAAG